MLKRRRLLLAGAATTLAATSSLIVHRIRGNRARAESQPERPSSVPISEFTKRSTAETVTAGLDLSSKHFLVTGATSGIGLETMRVLAMRGAHVIGTGRSLEKAREACRSLGKRATPLAMSLDDYESVVACATAVRAATDQLDGIVCNAGVMGLPALEQVMGVERHFAVNHLGHYLLTRQLFDRLISAPQARVVILSSSALAWASPNGIEWDNLSGRRDYQPGRAYGQSKLANALFSLELARRLRASRATSNALHPGYVDTNLFRHYPLSLRGPRGFFADKISVPQGAATSCYVASAPALARTSGHYFEECNPVIPDERARDTIAATKLWTISEQLVGKYLQ